MGLVQRSAFRRILTTGSPDGVGLGRQQTSITLRECKTQAMIRCLEGLKHVFRYSIYLQLLYRFVALPDLSHSTLLFRTIQLRGV